LVVALVAPYAGYIAVTLVGTAALAARAEAQVPPLIKLREIATLGPSVGSGLVAETHLAVSNTHVFVVHIQDSTPNFNGYAVKEKASGVWTQGNTLVNGSDPSVAYDGTNDRFVVCELKAPRAKITWWDRTNGFQAQPDAIINSLVNLDKPWIVAGQNDLWRQEFYISTSRWGESQYARSLDGGATWVDGTMGVTSVFCTEPSVATGVQDSPVYVVWTKGNDTYRVLRGDDNGASVDFVPLTDSAGAQVEVVLNRTCTTCSTLAPGPFPLKPSPHLATDPTNPNRLYLVYFDEAAGIPGDFDIFCVRLERAAGTTNWSAGPPVRVNDDINDPNDNFDQIQPDLAVDSAGRVHIVFYDDRAYIQGDSVTDAKYDVYYAYSLDAGLTFTNTKLVASPDQPALDHALDPVGDVVPLEYPGIATFGNEVWVSFAGTYDLDTTTPDKTVIWVTQIVFGN
jgi:hypothetical protein